MKIVITEIQDDKIYNTFKNIMKEFSKLEYVVREYDFWHHSKNGYVDYAPINFYKDEELDWEDDDWIFQYAHSEPYTKNRTGNYPMLLYSAFYFQNIKELFGPRFESLMRRWLAETYHMKINKFIDDREGSELLGIYD